MVIGLTGGIGSGKTSVLQLFINRGIPVYIADIEAKRIMHENPKVKKEITATFGVKSYKNNQLNRPYLASIVFEDKAQLALLNAIVHPAVHTHFLAFKAKQTSTYLVYENAILFENGSDALCDYIITVTAPETVRIERVVNRDKVTIKQVKERMQHQWNEALKIKKSDFTIENINWKSTEKQVEKLHKKFLRLAKQHK